MAVVGQVLENLGILHILVVDLEDEFLHVVSQQHHQGITFLALGVLGRTGYHVFYVLTVVTVFNRFQLILYRLGSSVQILLPDDVVKGEVHIELETAHDHEVVPQLVLVVGLGTQLGKHVGHVLHDGEGAACALVPVLNSEAVIHHLLDVAAILRQHQFLEK